jgi:hypothetical protein
MLGYQPVPTEYIEISDGSLFDITGSIRGVTLSEVKPGVWETQVSMIDGVSSVPGTTVAPFSFSDQSAEATYTGFMTYDNTVNHYVGGWIQFGIYEPYCWWRLGEASGTTADDQMDVQDGTYVNAPTLGVAGPMTTGDTAVTFNGTDEYVTCGSQQIGGQTDFSIAAWAKSSSANATQTIYCERHPTTGNAMVRLILDANGRPTFSYRDDGGGAVDSIVPTSGDWTDGAWHHFVVTKDATAIVMYVDGVSVKTGTLTNDNTLTGMSAYIGNDPRAVSQFFPGSLDEVMIWRSVIDVVMVRQLYALRDVRSYAKLGVNAVSDGTTTVTTATVTTYETGLATGQVTTATSDNYGLVAQDIEIREIVIEYVNASTIRYTLKGGDSPIHLPDAFV